MIAYGLVVLLVGVTLLSGAVILAMSLHRRWKLPYALLSVGMLTYLLALFVQVGLLHLTRGTILGIWPIRAITLGLVVGFTEETARLFGYQYLARGVVNKRQAVFIGLGHGFTVTIYTGVLALVLGFSLLGRASSRPDDLGDLLSGAVAEALNGILPILMHMALSWLVLLVFLRGELGWLFLAVFIHSAVEGTASWIGPTWDIVIWRAVIAVLSLILLRYLHPPAP